MVHVRLLGPLQVVDDEGVDRTPPGGRERRCLATLAAVAPNGLSTERLAAELYHDREATDPRNAVQAVISRLRRTLGRAASSIETTATGYRLVDVLVDVDEAGQLLQDAMSEADIEVAIDLLDTARAQWRGPTLDGATGPLLDAERLRIDNLRAEAEESIAARQVDAGVDHRVLDWLEAAVGQEPLRERRWELLMLALYRAGRQAEALRAFQRARAVLAEQLGLEPGPSLARLEQRILAHDPALDPSVGSGPDPGPDPSPDPGAPVANSGTASAGAGSESTGRSLPAGVVTILLCDVEGSVRKWEADPVDTAADIAELHERWGAATEARGGVVVKSTGDGVFAAFPTASSAVDAAVAAMTEQQAADLTVRAALHTGELQPVDDDYRGPVVNRCARLLELANGNQILVSSTAAELAKADLEPSITFSDLGPHWLRDVPEPIVINQVGAPGLPAAFEPLASHGPARLPRPRTTLLGRDGLVADVVAELDDRHLVVLLGPGGIGKTSVAVAAAWTLVDSRPVTFVDLARLTDPELVADRVADELGLADHDDGRSTTDRIADRLRTATDLVVIDNAEHMLDAVADLVDAVLATELKGSFLVTSRQPLGLPEETIVGVPPLALPESGDDLHSTSESPSVQLFLERAGAARSGREGAEIGAGLLPVVAHICRRLDGLPLAIELAAGRAALLSVDDIAARLDDQLRLLRQLQSSRERRHQSLEAVVAWSADQLSPSGRELFDRLSVMAGSFTVAGAEHLFEHAGLSADGVLDGLDELLGASLITTDADSERLRMLEPIRQFAYAELARRGLADATNEAHARWVTALAVDAHHRRDATRAEALAVIDAEADEMIAAIRWIAENGRADLVGELAFPCSWWFLTHEARAGDRHLTQLLRSIDRERDELPWALAVVALAVTTAAHPRSDVTDIVLEAIEVLDRHGHPEVGLARVAAAFAQTGTLDAAKPRALLEAAERQISSDDRWASAILDMSAMAIAGLALLIDVPDVDVETALARGDRAAKVFEELGEVWALAVTNSELGRIRQGLGDLEAAEGHYLRSLDLIAVADYHGHHYVFTELGRLASARGDHERASSYHRRALEIAEVDQNPGCVAMSIAGMASAAEARGDAGEAIELYRDALQRMEIASLVEHGSEEWRAALRRLTAEN